MEKIITSLIPEGTAPCRLDRYLSARFTYQSRSRWQKEIEGGRVRCNGNPVISCSYKVRPGDSLSYEGAGREEPPVDFSHTVIYEDEDLLAVNKSGNLPVHPSSPQSPGNLRADTLLQERRNDLGIPEGPCRRLQDIPGCRARKSALERADGQHPSGTRPQIRH